MNQLNDIPDKSSDNPQTFKEKLTTTLMEVKSSAGQTYSDLLVEYPLFFEYFQTISNLEVFCIVLASNVYYFRSRIFYLILQA